MPYSAEGIPEDVLKSLFGDNWVSYQDLPKPEFLVSNDPENAISMINLNEGDKVVIYSDPEQIFGRGNLQYYDRIITLFADIYTKESRQRLRDISKSLRAIIWINRHAFTGWQLIRPSGYSEMFASELNIWRAQMRFEVFNHAVAVDTVV